MKRLLTVLLILTAAAFAQGVRIGDGTPVSSTLNLSGVGNILTPSSTATIAICTYPANAVPCTNKATTYTTQALSVACATSVQVTLPGTSSCVANADSLGNWGAWVAPGSYDYTITVGSHSYGPYTVTNGSTALVANSALKDAIQDKGFVNAVTDCGAVGDGVTDDYTAIQNCITNNQERVIFFPKMRTAGSVAFDYYSSQTLLVTGRGTELRGGGGTPHWFYGVKIGFPTNTTGVFCNSTAVNCKLTRLTFEAPASDAFSGTDIRTWEDWTAETDFRGTTGLADGIRIAAGEWVIEDVAANNFRRHGLQIIGQGATGQPDLGKLNGFMANTNRACGIYTWGADANVGIYQSMNFLTDGICAISDNAFYGNTWIAPHTSGSGFPWTVAAGSNKTVTTTSVTANVKTINSTAHGWPVNTWVTDTGSLDATFNGTCKLTAVTTNTATCNFTHVDGSTSGGTAATATGTEIRAVYTARSITLNAYKHTSTAGVGTFITPYVESISGASSYGNAVVINPQGTAGSATDGHSIFGAAEGSVYFQGGHWIFRPTSASNQIILRDYPANSTNIFAVNADGVGGVTSTGSAAFGLGLGLNGKAAPTGIIGIQMANAKGVYFTNAAGNASLRGIYMHSDNILRIGDALGANSDGPFTTTSTASIGTTLQVTGVSTLTGGFKAGASGSTISDSRELVQNAHSCGTTTTCANTANGSNRMIFGSVALTSATPSTAVVSSITAFTSTSSYVCTLTNQTNAANNLLKVVNTSTTSFTITGPNTITDVIGYICIGN